MSPGGCGSPGSTSTWPTYCRRRDRGERRAGVGIRAAIVHRPGVGACQSGPGGGVSTGRIVPVYPLTAGLAQKSMRGLSRQALDLALESVEEYLPDEVRLSSRRVPPLRDAIAQFITPTTSYRSRRQRSGWLSTISSSCSLDWCCASANGRPTTASRSRSTRLLERWSASLPFRLTGTQQSVVAEILEDMSQQKPMTRLPAGDVGSGKTAVAAAAMLATRGTVSRPRSWRRPRSLPSSICKG